MTDSMIRYETTFESTENLPRVIALGHGENADLAARITDNGTEVDLANYTARAIYRPSSKFGSDDWYECPCEKVGNTVVVHWGNTYDNGDNAVIMWLHFLKDGKVAYPALYKMRLFETPGFTPSAITPIPETIDFSQYTLVNAPWVPIAGGVTLGGDLSTTHNLVHVATRTVTYKNLELTDDTESYYEQELVLSYDATDAAKLTQAGTDEVPIRISGVRASTGEPEVTDCVLVNPAESNSHVTWDVLEASTRTAIGDMTFGLDDNVPGVVRGELHRDYIMASYSYAADTTEQVTDRLNYLYDGSTFASKAELQALVTGIGNPALLVKKDRNGQVGHEGGILNLKITGDDDEYPLLEFDDTAEGGDVYVLMTNGPGGEGGEWHEIYLPNNDGTIVLDSDIIDKVKKLSSSAQSSPTFSLVNRMHYSMQKGSTYSWTPKLKLPEPDHTTYKSFYCVVDIINIGGTPNDAVISLVQPSEYTWTTMVDEGLTLASVLTIPAGKTARLYITQFGGWGPGTSGNMDALYIKRVMPTAVTA